ncbi:hypothetical protein CLG96_04340 [Sphingomonas oleivorans]|uniref:DUF218 domain-containing protein n=1 Tax=Sphingomonas oleivorans TaxID=1735121 RepID=A0A2T5G2G7_9SPHN|nr:YdcF family protein [Sphingomonas oleivorans]PTQ13334.1 hypothetical protein CLG96_04340 [Sphingomonas oleivorans]
MIARIVAFLLLVYLLGFPLFAVTLPTPAGNGPTDAIVVLTGGRGRVQHGLALLEARRARRMLVSGVDRRVKPHELAAQYGVPNGLIDCCVDLGHESVDTRSNAEETAEWLRGRRYRSVRLVTTDWHMPRARFELGRLLDPDVRLVADPVPSQPGLLDLVREYNKYLLRRIAAPLGI